MRNALFFFFQPILDRKSSVNGVGCFGLKGKGVVLVVLFDKIIDLAFAVLTNLSFDCQLMTHLSSCS